MHILAILLLLAAARPVVAQVQVGDDLFGNGELITDLEANAGTTATDELLTRDEVLIGGDVSFSARVDLDLDPSDDDDALTSGLEDLSARLFLDARPSCDLRAYVRAEARYATEGGLAVELREMFADVTVRDTVFLRAGLQTINWGVGTFYSPANLVNVERLEPQKPDETPAGPVALKAQWPLGNGNLTGYLILEDIGDENESGAAVRYELLVDEVEVTTGATFRSGGSWAWMATATGAVQDVTVFTEAVVQGGSDKLFVEKDAGHPMGYRITTHDDVFASWTVGGRYATSSEDERFSVALVAQYYFNGLGYADPTLFADDPNALAFALAQVATNAMRARDLQDRGRHNASLRVASKDVSGTGLTPSVLWLANLSDGSGLVRAGLSYAVGDHVALELDFNRTYGPDGAEYSTAGRSTTLGLSVIVGGSF